MGCGRAQDCQPAIKNRIEKRLLYGGLRASRFGWSCVIFCSLLSALAWNWNRKAANDVNANCKCTSVYLQVFSFLLFPFSQVSTLQRPSAVVRKGEERFPGRYSQRVECSRIRQDTPDKLEECMDGSLGLF